MAWFNKVISMRRRCAFLPLVSSVVVGGGCRSAVVVAPRDEQTQTIVTVQEKPATKPSDKGLIVHDRR